MDELDFLKQNWKKQEEDLPRLSYEEIYQMLWKRSSSIVRWIFFISIAELLLSTLLNIYFADAEYWKEMEAIHLKKISIGLYVIGYGITFFFIYRFYVNYRKISATDDAATLMKNILRTRKTVKDYIAYVLISTGLTSLIITFFTLKNHRLVQNAEDVSKYTFDAWDWAKLVVGGTVLLAILLLALWLFYRLIYGILLKRLKKNYTDLKKLEV